MSSNIDANMQRIEEEMLEQIAKAMYQNAAHLINHSVDNTPIDTGNLRGSATIFVNGRVRADGDEIDENQNKARESDIRMDKVEVMVGYNTEYAYKIHEMDDDNTNWTDPDTGSQYLKEPYEHFKRIYERNLARAIERALEEGR